MERVKIKCPVCGNEEFIPIEKPYREGFETYIQDYTQYYLCSECGLVLRFAKGLANGIKNQEFLETEKGKKWQKLNNESNQLSNRLKAYKDKLLDLKREQQDDRRSVARDKQIKEEIKEITKQLSDIEKKLELIEQEMKELRK